MKTKFFTVSVAALAVAVAACGDDEMIMQEPLPQEPVLSIFPPVLDFEVAAVDVSATSTASVSVTNIGQDPLELSNITVTGGDAGLFTVVEPASGSVTVASRATSLIEIEFAPTARGVFRAQLALDSNASNLSSATIELVGPAVSTTSGVGFPDLEPIDDPVTPFEGTDFALVGLYNLGRASVVITGYELTGTAFELGAGVVVPGASCAMNGEADCNGNPDDPSDDRDLFCFVNDPEDDMDDVCAVSIPGEEFINLQLDAVGTGSSTFTVTSNDPDEPSLSITLQN